MLPAVIEDTIQETKEQKRKRLASELRFITSQFNSKLLELMDTGVSVEITHGTHETLVGDENLMGLVDVSYQPPTKHY
ncbi:hypothetical protein MQM1_049 [Aeromonas phage vB_AsaP_MQM1]|nr:hypothetical protein MQM1_049 [Aeromonas phage vB_AsaP_MQM1]